MVKRSVALFGIVLALICVAPRASTSSAEDTRPDCDVVIGSASAGTIKPALTTLRFLSCERAAHGTLN